MSDPGREPSVPTPEEFERGTQPRSGSAVLRPLVRIAQRLRLRPGVSEGKRVAAGRPKEAIASDRPRPSDDAPEGESRSPRRIAFRPGVGPRPQAPGDEGQDPSGATD
jgi:hypothetical protein